MLSKALGIGITVTQCGCIAHCTFEYLADFVVVSNGFWSSHMIDLIVANKFQPNKMKANDIILISVFICNEDKKQISKIVLHDTENEFTVCEARKGCTFKLHFASLDRSGQLWLIIWQIRDHGSLLKVTVYV